jgi:hypothetical protein
MLNIEAYPFSHWSLIDGCSDDKQKPSQHLYPKIASVHPQQHSIRTEGLSLTPSSISNETQDEFTFCRYSPVLCGHSLFDQ